MSVIRVGMIGTGGISHLHARQLLELKEVEIAAIADTSKASREKFVSSYELEHIMQFDDYVDMLDQAELDAVVICSPHTLHYKHASDALMKGCHTLIEKPMTCSSDEAELLIRKAEQAGKLLQVSFQRHYEPEFMYMKHAIETGIIGRITSITASVYQNWKQPTTGTWRQIPELSGGGMLMDSGCHIADMLLWLTGLTPIEVKTQYNQAGTPVEVDSFTSIRFAEGQVASLNVVGCAPFYYETYVICGEAGGILYDNGKITVYRSGHEPIKPELPEQTTNSDKSFIDAIKGRDEVKVPGSYALQVVKMIEMIYRESGYKSF